MRSARSSFATTRIAPSSTPLRPSFHCSATRSANCSIVSGCGRRHDQHRDLAALARSRTPRALLERAALLARVERAGEVGDARRERRARRTSAAATTGRSSDEARHAEQSRCADRTSAARAPKSTVGGFAIAFSFSTVKLRLLLVAEHHRGEVGRERAHRDVVLLHRLDVAVARHGDAVLGAFELRLQVAEVRVGLELRIVLRHDEQPRQRAGQLALRRLEALRTPRGLSTSSGVAWMLPTLARALVTPSSTSFSCVGVALHRVRRGWASGRRGAGTGSALRTRRP